MFDEEADGDQLISLPSVAAICVLRAKKSLFSSGSLCGNGPGKDDGRFYTKPPSPGRIIQSCVRASSQVQIYSFVHCLSPIHSLVYPTRHSLMPSLIHAFTQQLLSSCLVPDALLGPGDKTLFETPPLPIHVCGND